MSGWINAVNPTADLSDADAARMSARGSSVALLISGMMSMTAAAMMLGRMPELRLAASEAAAQMSESSEQTGALVQGMVNGGMVEASVALVALWAIVQFLLSAWQWRRPGQTIPMIFIALLAYRLGDRLLQLVRDPSDVGALTVVSLVLIALCLLLHVCGLRGASRLRALRRSA